jgi:hypothetical protein
VGFEDVGEVLAYDVAAGRSEDVADEKNVHLWSLARAGEKQIPRGKDREKGEGRDRKKLGRREGAVDFGDD